MTMHGASSCERPAHSFPEPESVFLLSKRSGMHFAKNKFPPPRLRPVSSEPGPTSRVCFGQEASPFLEAAHHPPGQQRPPPMTAAPCLGPAPPGSGTGHHGSSAVGKLFFFFFFLKLMLCFSPESATNGNFRIPLFSKNYRPLVSSSLSQAINH